jgi:hypothetical protein
MLAQPACSQSGSDKQSLAGTETSESSNDEMHAGRQHGCLVVVVPTPADGDHDPGSSGGGSSCRGSGSGCRGSGSGTLPLRQPRRPRMLSLGSKLLFLSAESGGLGSGEPGTPVQGAEPSSQLALRPQTKHQARGSHCTAQLACLAGWVGGLGFAPALRFCRTCPGGFWGMIPRPARDMDDPFMINIFILQHQPRHVILPGLPPPSLRLSGGRFIPGGMGHPRRGSLLLHPLLRKAHELYSLSVP